MTDTQGPPVAAPGGGDDVAGVAAQAADTQGAEASQDGDALVLARFGDMDAAMAVHDRLLQAEISGWVIDGVLVVKADGGGKLHVQRMTEHSTRKGLKWGIVGGIVAGVFLPATIVGGAVAVGIAGAAAGRARALHHEGEIEKELAGVMKPGTSGILVLAPAAWAAAIAEKLPEAQAVKTVPVDAETADAIRAAAGSSIKAGVPNAGEAAG